MVLALLAPLLAAAVAGVFAVSLAGQWRRKRRDHALAWAVSLSLFMLGALGIAAGVGLGWNAVTFGMYWLGGALLCVPWLAVGQLHLMAPKLSVLWWTVAGLFTAWALFGLLITPVESGALAAVNAAGGIPRGADVYDGGVAPALIGPSNWTSAVVVLGSLWSGFRTRRWGVLLIAVGVMVAGASFAFIRTGQGELVSVTLAAGVSLMYLGFRAAGRPPRRPAPAPGQPAAAGT
jgi:hypothetical protein